MLQQKEKQFMVHASSCGKPTLPFLPSRFSLLAALHLLNNREKCTMNHDSCSTVYYNIDTRKRIRIATVSWLFTYDFNVNPNGMTNQYGKILAILIFIQYRASTYASHFWVW